ncbi:MAG: precorrin-6y C5,15-methyltransferase (decarboxylating) subunit CbiE, partial [Synechococcaceae bacterium WB8_1B_136]|nr:precorrin-6y C5,15-methyltransferase (decarboxylating) subunit CbiE [Synechococcaceae bacterium WB8_1B_136]
MIEVIGTDAGAPDTLPPMQQRALRQAAVVAAPRRLHPALQHWAGRTGGDACPALWATDQLEPLLDHLAALPHDRPVVVLASGDPLWFGIGRQLLQRIEPARLRFHPAPSSLQLAFARIGRPWQDAAWVSLHGRDPEPLAAALQKRPPALAVLTDPGRGGAEEVRRLLAASGLEAAYGFWLCERLGHPEERVQRLAP